MTDRDRISLLRAALYEAKGTLFEAAGAVSVHNAEYGAEFRRAGQAVSQALREDEALARKDRPA